MLRWLDERFPDEPFPGLDEILADPEGLVAIGGCLSPRRIVNAYRAGIFPWFNEGEPILWWSPDPRWVLEPGRVRISRSLGKSLRNKGFEVSHDRAFNEVIQACSEPRAGASGTWISEEMKLAYGRLHQLGVAHSFEVWLEGSLVGGLYGVALGRMFFGESMFHRVTDASKVGFVKASECLNAWGYGLMDCQVHTPHLESLGAIPISRSDFCFKVAQLTGLAPSASAWSTD